MKWSITSWNQVFRIFVFLEHPLNGVFQLILILSMLFMSGLMHWQTILLVLVMMLMETMIHYLISTGQLTFIWLVRTLLDSIQFTGQLCWWHWMFHCLSRSLVTHGYSLVILRWVSLKVMSSMRMILYLYLVQMQWDILCFTKCHLHRMVISHMISWLKELTVILRIT